jgi:DNA-binding PadR family transcriptional regulator
MGGYIMSNYDREKVDEVVLALMSLTLHDSSRAWKGVDWDTLDRLYEKGWIDNPRRKTKSVQLTEEGLARAAQLFEHYFGKSKPPTTTRSKEEDEDVI